MYKISIHKYKRVFYVISKRGLGIRTKQNTIGLANPTKWGEREGRPYGVKRSHGVAERESPIRAFSNSFPFTPPLENANEHAKICLGNWFEYLDILAPTPDLSGSSEAKTTTFAHPLGLKQHRSISKYCDILIY